MGGLHIEMASLRMLGHWLDGSGWLQCLVESDVTTTGVAESCISASHVKRTRYAHSVTAAALYICLRRCYNKYCKDTDSAEQKPFDEWRSDCENQSAQFKFWSTALNLEMLVLSFVRSLRMGDFALYVDTLQAIAPWFFALDQVNYARWLPVHLRDMLSFQEQHPHIYEQFVCGKFTISKSGKKFSSISVDQAHEQLNALIKGTGGAIGLTENEAALCRWITAGPEVVRCLLEFEGQFVSNVSDFKHHEQTNFFQCRFRGNVVRLVEVFEEELPFTASSHDDLQVLCVRTFADLAVSNTVKSAEQIGRQQLSTFVSERLCGSVPV